MIKNYRVTPFSGALLASVIIAGLSAVCLSDAKSGEAKPAKPKQQTVIVVDKKDSQTDSTTQVLNPAAKEQAALVAAETWLALIDSDKHADSWKESASLFKNAVTQEQWEQAMKASRNPLGKLISRKVMSKTYSKSLPGAPDGEYVVIQFETSFDNKKSAVETVTPMMDKDGHWRVSGYYIR